MKRRLLSTTLSLTALMALATLGLDTTADAAPAIGAASPSVAAARSLTGLLINDPDAEYNLGNDAFGKGDYKGAVAHFTQALHEKSSFSDANFNRGMAYEALKDYKSAVSDFTVVITKQPKMYDAYVERGRAYSGAGDYASAGKDLSTAISLKASKPDAYLARADANFNQKGYDAAVADYTKYFELATADGTQIDPSVYENRGEANYAAQHYDPAIADFKKVIALQPQQAGNAYAFLGDSYVQKKDYASAVEAYTKYIAANPNDKSGTSLKGRAFAYYQSKKFKPAIDDYTAYLAINPNDSDATAGLILAKQGAGINPINDLKAAVAREPNNMGLRGELADALVAAKDYAGAIEQYNMIIAKEPNNTGAIFNRAVAEGQSGDKAKAVADFTAYTHAKPSDPLGFKYLGIYQATSGDWKDSIAAFTQYIAMKPDDPEAYKDRGLAEYNSQAYPAAKVDLEKYDGLKPNDPEVAKVLPDVYSQTGDTNGAITRYKQYCTAHPTDPTGWMNLGVAYTGAKNYQEAIEPLSKSIALKSDPLALFDRGFAYYNLGKAGNTAAYAKASADATAALEAKPDYSDAAELKADTLFADKQYKAASVAYASYAAMAGIPADSKNYAQVQELQCGILSQDFDAVIKATTDMIATNPNEASYYLARGTAYIKKMNYMAAIADLQKYNTMKPTDGDAFYYLGIAYQGSKDNVNAAPAFEKALSLKADNAAAATQAGLAYQTQADAVKNDGDKAGPLYDKAIAMFDKAATLKPGTKEGNDALFNEATCLEAKSKSIDNKDPLKLAIPIWEKWLAAAPTDPDAPRVKTHVAELKSQTSDN